jgi:hypothetical protein
VEHRICTILKSVQGWNNRQVWKTIFTTVVLITVIARSARW